MRTRFLNPVVEREVRDNETLFVAWCLTIDDVDDDIDPTHNPDWVKRRQQREANLLATLKVEVADLIASHKSGS